MLLSIYEWVKDPTRRVIVETASVPFKNSETFRREWYEVARVDVSGPFMRPIPREHALYVAKRSETFPYHTISVEKVENIFTPRERGIYFIASSDVARKIIFK
jgi:hypothetical protein